MVIFHLGLVRALDLHTLVARPSRRPSPALAVLVEDHGAALRVGRVHGARPEQVRRIGDLRGQIVLLGAAEVGIGQVAIVLGQVGGPASALGRLGDVAQIGEADRRIGVAPLVVGLDGDVGFGEAVGR